MLPTAAGFVFMTSLKANQKPTNSCRLGIIEKVVSPVSLQFPSLTQTLSKLQSIFLLRLGPAIILMSAKKFWIATEAGLSPVKKKNDMKETEKYTFFVCLDFSPRCISKNAKDPFVSAIPGELGRIYLHAFLLVALKKRFPSPRVNRKPYQRQLKH